MIRSLPLVVDLDTRINLSQAPPFEPEEEIGEADVRVGVCPDELKDLWRHGVQAVRKREELLLQHLAAQDDGRYTDAHRFMVEVIRASHEVAILTHLFWDSITRVFPRLASQSVIAVRKGFVVVWSMESVMAGEEA